MKTPDVPYDESATTEEMLFALGRRDKPTVGFVECASLAKRNELEILLAERLPEYQFHTIDMTPFPVVSLLRTLSEQLPEEVKNSPPVTYVVNVHGLENSLLINEDGQLAPSLMTAQLNLERELLFRRVPYILLLWGDGHFFRTLQREAPDLWHWVTYKFRFEDHTALASEQLRPLPPERLPQKGNIKERQERIQELKGRYEHLLLDGSDKKRLLKDKVSILSLLAQEYAEAFQYNQAEEAYQTAIALQEILHENHDLRGELLFNLGTVYLTCQKYPQALAAYMRSKKLASKQTVGNVHFQLGKTFAKQGQWSEALENYHQSISYRQKTGAPLGNVYHQIGVLHQAQQHWSLALKYYQQALMWNHQTFDARGIGFAYHHIGMVYRKLNQLAAAMENYKQAIMWKEKTGNVFELGSTYGLIGTLYADQQQWVLALENYQLALLWDQKTGNDLGLSSTYINIAIVYVNQEMLDESVPWYEKAIANFAHHGQSASTLSELEADLAVVRENIRSSSV